MVGSAASRPVNGLIFEENSSGPKLIGGRCGCGVDVGKGVVVDDAVIAADATA